MHPADCMKHFIDLNLDRLRNDYFKEVILMGREVKTGALVAHVLKQEGVKYIFGLPGGHIYPTAEEADKLGIKFISTRDEMSAAYAAEGWALATGQVGVCSCTAGPGVTNMLSGVANAWMGRYPVFYIGGKARVTEYDRNQLQDFDQISIIQTMSKHARTVYEPLRVPEYTARAISHAVNGTPGPAYIEIPRDITDSMVDFDQANFAETYRAKNRVKAEDEAIAKAAEMIKEAKKPLIVAGSGVWWSQAQDELTALANKTNIPVFTRNAARGCFDEKSPMYVSNKAKKPILEQSDLVIIVGTRAGYTFSQQMIRKDQKIIRIDIDPVEVTNQWDATLTIVGDAKAVLAQLVEAVEEKSNPEWAAMPQIVDKKVWEVFEKLCPDPKAYPINPIAFYKELLQEIDDDTIVIIDGGDSATWSYTFLPCYGPGQMMGIAGNAFGPLGVGMGYAMASKLAHPEKKVLLITGDGAFGYGIPEFDTCMRYGIQVTAVIFNDGLWGMIKRSEQRKAPNETHFVGLDLEQNTHYEKVVEGFGGYGELVTHIEDLRPAIQRAVASGKPGCVNVMVNPAIGPKGAGC